RNSLFLEPTVVQRKSHNLILAHPPVTFTAPRRHMHCFGICSQSQQVAAARAWLFPLLPIIQPHPPPDPLRQSFHLTIRGAELVVVEPTPDIEVQLVDDGLNLVPAVAAGDF